MVTKLSVVCPAYEEEEVLPAFHATLCAVLAALPADYDPEILYVDDGSCDGTLAWLRAAAAGDPRVRYLSLSRNFGHQAALTAGLEHAAGDVVVTLDCDLQHPPGLLPKLLERWRDGFDVVLTERRDDPRLGLLKRVTSRAFYRLMRHLSDTEISIAAADYRLLSRRAVDALGRLRETHRFLRGMVDWLGFPTARVAYDPGRRAAGHTKYTLPKMLRFAADALLSFSKLPLRLLPAAGVAAALAGVLAGGAFAAQALRAGGPADLGWRVVLVAVLVLGGGILGALGLVGEYVGRIYDEVKGRPLYLLKEASPPPAAGRDRFAAPSHRPVLMPGYRTEAL